MEGCSNLIFISRSSLFLVEIQALTLPTDHVEAHHNDAAPKLRSGCMQGKQARDRTCMF